MTKRIVLGVHMKNRVQHAPEVQKLLTEYGCNIRTRLGLHAVDETACSTSGLLLLELYGADETCLELAAKLAAIKDLDVQKMVFDRD